MNNPFNKSMTALYNGLEEAREMFKYTEKEFGRNWALESLETAYKGKALEYLIS